MVSKESYRHSSPYGTNRWRARDFEEAFTATGFEIREQLVTESREITDEEYQSFDPYFRNRYQRKELEPLGIRLTVSKKI